MPEVVRTDIDRLNAVITVTIPRSDYEPKLEKELNKYRHSATLKGFRKGKAPLNMIKKLVGPSFLLDTINDLMSKAVTDFLTEDDTPLLGQPMPSPDTAKYDFHLDKLEDYVFKFDIGLEPQIELQGLTPDTTLTQIELEVTDEMLNEELEHLRLRNGESASIDEDIQMEDMIELLLREYEGDDLKEGGIENTAFILVKDMTEETQQIVLGLKKGDALRVDIRNLEPDRDDAFIREFFLGLGKDSEQPFNDTFEAVIMDVKRVQPEEMNETFFDYYFGEGVVSNVAEAKDKLRQFYKEQNAEKENDLFYGELQMYLFEKNPIELPDAFLKRWMLFSDEEATQQKVEAEYPNFSFSLKWSILRNKLFELLHIKSTRELVLEFYKDSVRRRYGLDDAVLDQLAKPILNDEKMFNRYQDELLHKLMIEGVKNYVKVETKQVTSEEYKALVQSINERFERLREIVPAIAE